MSAEEILKDKLVRAGPFHFRIHENRPDVAGTRQPSLVEVLHSALPKGYRSGRLERSGGLPCHLARPRNLARMTRIQWLGVWRTSVARNVKEKALVVKSTPPKKPSSEDVLSFASDHRREKGSVMEKPVNLFLPLSGGGAATPPKYSSVE